MSHNDDKCTIFALRQIPTTNWSDQWPYQHDQAHAYYRKGYHIWQLTKLFCWPQWKFSVYLGKLLLFLSKIILLQYILVQCIFVKCLLGLPSSAFQVSTLYTSFDKTFATIHCYIHDKISTINRSTDLLLVLWTAVHVQKELIVYTCTKVFHTQFHISQGLPYHPQLKY